MTYCCLNIGQDKVFWFRFLTLNFLFLSGVRTKLYVRSKEGLWGPSDPVHHGRKANPFVSLSISQMMPKELVKVYPGLSCEDHKVRKNILVLLFSNHGRHRLYTFLLVDRNGGRVWLKII